MYRSFYGRIASHGWSELFAVFALIMLELSVREKLFISYIRSLVVIDIPILLVVAPRAKLSSDTALFQIRRSLVDLRSGRARMSFRGSVEELVLLNIKIRKDFNLDSVVLHEHMLREMSYDSKAAKNVVN
jgi:hypothetical protein